MSMDLEEAKKMKPLVWIGEFITKKALVEPEWKPSKITVAYDTSQGEWYLWEYAKRPILIPNPYQHPEQVINR